MAYIRNVDTQDIRSLSSLTNGHRIIQVLGILTVYGYGLKPSQIQTAGQLPGPVLMCLQIIDPVLS